MIRNIYTPGKLETLHGNVIGTLHGNARKNRNTLEKNFEEYISWTTRNDKNPRNAIIYREREEHWEPHAQ